MHQHTPSALRGRLESSAIWMQGLSAMKVHKSRLEKERDEVAAQKAAEQEKPLPSYMRATKASIAMKKVRNFSLSLP